MISSAFPSRLPAGDRKEHGRVRHFELRYHLCGVRLEVPLNLVRISATRMFNSLCSRFNRDRSSSSGMLLAAEAVPSLWGSSCVMLRNSSRVVGPIFGTVSHWESEMLATSRIVGHRPWNSARIAPRTRPEHFSIGNGSSKPISHPRTLTSEILSIKNATLKTWPCRIPMRTG